ncbi:hypothetical protein [Taibaiella soli]|uniref:Uncharacterized protein n=1 Tax=Taibaiella soli TaxID=1649169 RepID=A0A2W2BFT2_9BACT|nr:hypothetical protein [Taibaiella soli]PZF74747.1 hypothetical protein DN068_00685 [Taibaiella soli]
MANANNETGHYKNVANFKGLIQFCESLGSSYRPSRPELTVVQLNTTCSTAIDVMDQINTAEIALSKATNARILAYGALPKLITRLANGLEAINPSSDVLKTAHHYVAKARGKRMTTPEAPAADAKPEDLPKTRSVSQRSYDAQLANFVQLVNILTAEPLYHPNETEVTITALQEKVQNLVQLNGEWTAASNQMKLLTAQRQQVLYAPVTGLVSVAESVKKYLKSLYMANSKEMKAANAFAIRKLK